MVLLVVPKINCLLCGCRSCWPTAIGSVSFKSLLMLYRAYFDAGNNFLFSKGVTQCKIVPSLGATETYPFTGSSEIISDITSTGATLKANNLRILKDGYILKSTACVLFSRKSFNVLKKSGVIDLF